MNVRNGSMLLLCLPFLYAIGFNNGIIVKQDGGGGSELGTDIVIAKLVEQNQANPKLTKIIRTGKDIIQISGEFCVNLKRGKVRCFVLSYEDLDSHCVATADANYKILDFLVGSGRVDSLRTLIKTDLGVSEIVVGEALPCHYTISETGLINAVFSSRTGVMSSAKYKSQKNYLESFSWPQVNKVKGPEAKSETDRANGIGSKKSLEDSDIKKARQRD